MNSDSKGSAERRESERIERIRFSREIKFADQLALQLDFTPSTEVCASADRVRRSLLASHVRLSENMAPEIFDSVRRAAAALQLNKPVEVYQAAGEENAANWRCDEAVFVSLQGSMLSQLDSDCLTALLGHEFGHHLAHTNTFGESPRQWAMNCASSLALDRTASLESRVLASRLSMAREFTADRFSAIATSSLEAPLRLMMSVVTGLPSERLKSDLETYRAQACTLFDRNGEKEYQTVGSHPEHLLRAYALCLFAETDVFRDLTGKGAGTRTLAEIDHLLEQLLTGNKERVFETQPEAAVPPEVHEFALCAASLMANADGNLDESESKALEQTFSALLPNWKDLLVPERARERFEELLPLAMTGGGTLATSVFNVLVHVMLADREVHVRELDTLSAVGRSLDQELLFESLLQAVVRATRIDRTESRVERSLPALPPGRHEAQAALDGILSGISRRGGGRVSLSRLLRILGAAVWDESTSSTVNRSLASHQLVLEAPPVVAEDRNASSDQLLSFRLTDQEASRREAAAIKDSANELANVTSQSALVTALNHLRERLVSGDGRSPSVRLYRAAPGRHFDLTQLDSIVEGRSERIIAMLQDNSTIPMLSGEESGKHKAAEDVSRSIRALEREVRSRVEETGTMDLFLGYPFLLGVVKDFFVRAPLILHPFSLAGDNRGSGSYNLKRRDDDPPTANQALIRLIFAKLGFSFTEEFAATLDDKAAQGPEALLEELRRVGLNARPLTGAAVTFEGMTSTATELLPEGIAVSENAVLGFFPQSSSDLLQDYDDLLAKLEEDPHANLQEMLNAAAQLLPANYRPIAQTTSDCLAPAQPIIFADPTQRKAVVRSRSARLLVVDGPPGTGKSQTIVNLIADELARGGRVAIVCEKRVALDVVKQRMDAAGIGHLAVVVHDVYEDRKRLYSHIADRLESPERREFDESTLAEAVSEINTLETKLAERANLLSKSADTGMTIGQLHTMAASFGVTSANIPELAQVKSQDLTKLFQLIRQLHPYAWLWKKDSVLGPLNTGQTRASLADASDERLANIGSTLREAHKAASDYARKQTERNFPADLLDSVEPALKVIKSIASQISSETEFLGSAISMRINQAARIGEIEECFAITEKHRNASLAEKERIVFESSNELVAALSVAAKNCSSFIRFLNPGWYRASSTIRGTLVRQWPEKAGVPIAPTLLGEIERRMQAGKVWRAVETIYAAFQIQSRIPGTADSLHTEMKGLLASWQISKQLIPLRTQLEAISLWPFDSTQAINLKEWLSQCENALDHLAGQRAYFEWAGKASEVFPRVAEMQPKEIAALTEGYSKNSFALRQADQVLQKLTALMPNPSRLAEKLSDALPSATAIVWVEAAAKGWAEAKIDSAASADCLLSSLDQEAPLGSLENASKRLIELHKTVAKEEAKRLAKKWDAVGLMGISPAEPRVRRTPEQIAREALIRECRKQRNVAPMRTLVRQNARQGLLDVVPVWLMSPETTVILFPRQPVFDLMIVDEASQCTVENGLPVLTRAHRAVVAGDDKQMPPSSFFKAGSLLQVENADQTAEVPVDAFESESLLVLAKSGGEGSPLRWHYRALFEELIAFSNHSMYGGSLLTVPATRSRSASPALRWICINNGKWEDGSNEPEAERVVDVLWQLLSRPKPPSVGIVTFNLQQRQKILDEIDSRRARDAAFALAFDAAATAESLDSRPFVKNLESVQGDERDVIIFSLGYAPTQRIRRDGSSETYVPARFGPLGQKGGERRLNVAVSRAKAEIIVVSSFDPSLLSVAHTKHDGPRMFKAFVEFARHLGEGRRSQAEKILSLVHDPSKTRGATAALGATDKTYLPLHHQVALTLENQGFKVETMIGSSEFRLPVAVVHSNNSHNYSLAILCDEGTTTREVFEDYVHVPNLLGLRGWQYIWISSREWHRDREKLLNRVRSALVGTS